MGTTNFTELRDEVVLDLPGASLPLIDHHAVRVIQRFCKLTYSWTFDQDAISIVDGQSDYELDSHPSYSDVERVLVVVMDGVTLNPGIDYTIANRCHDIHIVAEPTKDILEGLEVQVALRPKLTATYICDRYYDDWFEVWVHGLLARMMAMPAKTWTNPQLSVMHNAMFWDGVRDSKIEQQKGGTVRLLTARPKYKFA